MQEHDEQDQEPTVAEIWRRRLLKAMALSALMVANAAVKASAVPLPKRYHHPFH
jgi:hypothetical protein